MKRPTYYELLGLSQGATQEEIKKRFRELARRYHPDVARTADAAERFKEINEAHRVLSDPQRRANYDAELKLAGLRAEGEEREAPPGAAGPAKEERQGRPERPAPNTAHRAPPPGEALVAAAAAAFRRMKFREAEAFCREALRHNRRYPAAYEILGDIHRMRGRVDEAIAMYSFALQLDPSNRSVRVKFDRLVGQPSGPTMAGHAARTSRAPGGRRAPTDRGRGAAGVTPSRALVNGIGAGLVAFLLIVLGLSREPAATGALIVGWDPLAIFALLTAGVLGGLMLSLNGLLLPAREELAQRSLLRYKRLAVSLGAVLIVVSLLFFYAAFLIYVLVGFVQGTVSTSVLRAFGVSFAIAALFALVNPIGAIFLFLFGGNIVFVAFIAGWAAGDLFRR